MKRVDIYSILIKHGYKLPKFWKTITDARKDIYDFIKNNINLTDEIKSKVALYDDNQWKKLIWRLFDNGHIR